jgi:membrane-bound lytic murein transglycosylase MltF
MFCLFRRLARFALPVALALAVVILALPLPLPVRAQGTVAVPSAEAPEPAAAADIEADALVDWLAEPWQGDLPGILERGFLRVGTAYNPVLFSYSGADQRGIVVDLTNELQAHLRKQLGKAASNLTIILAALPRNQMLPALESGRVDVLMANLTVTPERQARIDFTNPLTTGVREVLVTGPSAPAIASLDDLAGVTLFLRPSSSYAEHVRALNAARKAAGSPELKVEPMDENMEDSDILELVGVGTLPAAIVDGHMAQLYARIIDGLTVHEDIAVNEGGEIAWAIRKDSPELMAALNGFIKRAAKGTLLGNTLIKRYFDDTKRVENAMAGEPVERLREAMDLIHKYSDEYGFDMILIAAQGYQESGLDQKKRSAVGAIGIMQVMPQTARDPVVGIPDIHVADSNVRAGVKYLRFLRDRYFSDPAMDEFNQTMFSFAAYNAGPGNISKARKRAVKMGLDPNVWFGNVELATAKAVSREPVVYVRNILKYYVTYTVYRERLALQAKP